MRENLPASLAVAEVVEVSLLEPLLVSNATNCIIDFSGSGYYCNRLPLICGLLQKVYIVKGEVSGFYHPCTCGSHYTVKYNVYTIPVCMCVQVLYIEGRDV